MKKIAVIDIGSNSIRLVIVKINKNNYFNIVDDFKETVRLGKDMTPHGELNPARVEKAIETLTFFKYIYKAHGVTEIITVATEAVRKASNQIEFINRVKLELDIEIKILTGIEEAYYDYFANINSMDISDALLMDIGGSSTELILLENRTIKASISLPFGAINLTDKFNLSKSMDSKTEKDLKSYILTFYKKILWLKKAKNIPIIGIGGTMRNIGKISKKRCNYPIDNLHNYHTTLQEVIEIYSIVKSLDSIDRKKIKGLSKERADIFLGAITAVVTLFQFLNLKELYVSGCGLREGIIYEYILKDKPVEDVLEFSIYNHMLNYEINLNHAKKVWDFSKYLYGKLKPLIDKEDNYKILKTSSLLHDCGLHISPYNYTEHSFYVIQNLKINGLTHKQQLMAAYTAGFHSENYFKIDEKYYGKILDRQDIEVIKKLAILLKICESLDCGINNNIQIISCSLDSKKIIIEVKSSTHLLLEISEALKWSDDFEKIFDRKLFIRLITS